MIETDGLAILYAWLLFAALLCALAFVILRKSADRGESSAGTAGRSGEPSGRFAGSVVKSTDPGERSTDLAGDTNPPDQR